MTFSSVPYSVSNEFHFLVMNDMDQYSPEKPKSLSSILTGKQIFAVYFPSTSITTFFLECSGGDFLKGHLACTLSYTGNSYNINLCI